MSDAPITSMSNEEIRREIATLLGYEIRKLRSGYLGLFLNGEQVTLHTFVSEKMAFTHLPNYPADLNAAWPLFRDNHIFFTRQIIEVWCIATPEIAARTICEKWLEAKRAEATHA